MNKKMVTIMCSMCFICTSLVLLIILLEAGDSREIIENDNLYSNSIDNDVTTDLKKTYKSYFYNNYKESLCNVFLYDITNDEIDEMLVVDMSNENIVTVNVHTIDNGNVNKIYSIQGGYSHVNGFLSIYFYQEDGKNYLALFDHNGMWTGVGTMKFEVFSLTYRNDIWCKEFLIQSSKSGNSIEDESIFDSFLELENSYHKNSKLLIDTQDSAIKYSKAKAVFDNVNDIITMFEYEAQNNEIYISKYIGLLDIVEIPSHIEDKPVVRINRSAFAHSDIKEIVFPSTMRIIDEYAFNSCRSLETVNFNEGIETIGTFSFTNCDSIEEIFLPSNVISIGTDQFNQTAFHGISGLKKINVDVNNFTFSSKDGVLFDKEKKVILLYPMDKQDDTYLLPKTVNAIEDGAFQSNIYLKEIELHNELHIIGDHAFFACTALERITIPSSVYSIGRMAFYACNSLKEVFIADNPLDQYLGISLFIDCPKDMVIRAPKYSPIYYYAQENGIKFEPLDYDS